MDKHSEVAAVVAAAGQVGVLHTVRRVGDTMGAGQPTENIAIQLIGDTLLALCFLAILDSTLFALTHENDHLHHST